MIEVLKGYTKHLRSNGQPWFLCNVCEELAYVSNDEEIMKEHVKEKHS